MTSDPPPLPDLLTSAQPLLAGGRHLVLCDIWGVVHNGRAPFAAAARALKGFRAAGHTVILISNAPRPSRVIPQQFKRLGVEEGICDAIVTSGDVAVELMRERIEDKDLPVFHLGPARDNSLFEGLNVRKTALAEAALVICTGLPEERPDERPGDFDPLLREIAGRGIDFVCANPDIVVQNGAELIYCAGALAERVAAFGGSVLYSGKPAGIIYRRCLALAADLAGPFDKSHILAVGDGLSTDIKGANDFGIRSLFILGGIHAGDLWGRDGIDRPALERLMRHHGAHPTAIAAGLCS